MTGYSDPPFTTQRNLQWYSRGSGNRFEVIVCQILQRHSNRNCLFVLVLGPGRKDRLRGECVSVWSRAVWAYTTAVQPSLVDHILTFTSQDTTRIQSLTVPAPDVPSEPESLFDTDLSGDRVIFLKNESKVLLYVRRGWKKWMRLTKGSRQVNRLGVCCRHLLCIDLVLPFNFHHFLLFAFIPFS